MSNRHLIIRGDHDAGGNIVVTEKNDGTFAFITTANTDTVSAEIRCGEPLTASELHDLGKKLMQLAGKKAR
jgi:hypothetical protein